MNSLSKVGKAKVSLCITKYKINGITLGNILPKVIIREIHLDNQAKTTSIRPQLSSLDAYIGTIGCNITKFNAHVKLLLARLSARGETSNDMLTNLLKGCKSVSNSVFFKYIERKQETYDNGQDLTPTDLSVV